MPDPEVDEYGIPIKKKQASASVDEFGIPIKKKGGTIELPNGGSNTNSQSPLPSNGTSNVPSNGGFLIDNLYPQKQQRAVSESTAVAPELNHGEVVKKLTQAIPYLKKKEVKAITDNNIQNKVRQGTLLPATTNEGSRDYEDERKAVEDSISEQDYIPLFINPAIRENAISDFSAANKEKPEDVNAKLANGDYILEDGKVKLKGGFLDNLGQGIKDAVNTIGLGLNIEAAKANKDTDANAENEIHYHLNQFNNDKKYSKEFTGNDVVAKTGKGIGSMLPYAIPYADVPAMAVSNVGNNAQEIWSDPNLTDREKVRAINTSTSDALMIGGIQVAGFHYPEGELAPSASDLLKKYAPTANLKYKFGENLYNNFNKLLKTTPQDVVKASGVFAGTEFLNQLNKNNVGVSVDFSRVPEAALDGATLTLLTKIPKVLTAAYGTIREAKRTGYDKVNPEWYNSYSKDTQDALNNIASAPEPVYQAAISQLDGARDTNIDVAKQKIQTFRNYHNSLPEELSPEAKNKALHILQLKTEAVNNAKNAPEGAIADIYEKRALAYDGLLNKIVNEGDINEKKEPLLISRFTASEPPKIEPPTHIDINTGETIETKPAVVMPDEVNRPSEATISPDETLIPKPEDKSGAAVILPQSNKEPNIIPLSNEAENTKATDESNKVVTANEGGQEANLAENTSTTEPSKEDLIQQAKDSVAEVNEMYQQPLLDDTESSLKEIAQQLNSSESEARTTRKTFGDKVSDIALKLFPDEKVEAAEVPIIQGTTNNNEPVSSKEEGQSSTATIEIGKGAEEVPPIEYKPTINDQPFVDRHFSEAEKEHYNTLDDTAKEKMIDDKREQLKNNVTNSDGNGKPPNNNTVQVPVGKEGNTIGITHAALDKLSEELGLPDRYEKDPTTVEAWDKSASERIGKGDMPQLVSKLEYAMKDPTKSELPTAVEQRMLLQYVSGLKAEYESNPSDKVLSEFKRIKELSDVVAGRLVAQSLRARQGEIPVHPLDGGILSAMSAKMEANGVDKLTAAEKQEVEGLVAEYKKTAENEAAKRKEIEDKYNDFLAQKELETIKTETKKATSSKGKPKTREEYVAERKTYKDQLKEARDKHLQNLKDQGIQQAGASPVVLTTDMAKIIGKIIKSHLAEVADNVSDVLSHVVDKTLDEIKDIFPELSERDVRDVIAGKYSEKKETKNELQAKSYEIAQEQKLLDEYERVLKGEAKTEKQKQEKNTRLADLRKKVDLAKAEIKSVADLEKELERVQERRDKEPSEVKKRELTEKEKELKSQIAEQKGFNSLEDELADVRNRIKKEPSSIKKRELSDREKEVVRQIKEEKRINSLEDELERLKQRKEKATNPKEKQELSDKEIELAEQVKSERQSWQDELHDIKKIKSITAANKRIAEKLIERIDNKDFDKEKAVPFSENFDFRNKYPAEFTEAINAIQAKEEARKAFDLAIVKDEMERQSNASKVGDFLIKAKNTSQAVVAGVDDSLMFVQLGYTLVRNPTVAINFRRVTENGKTRFVLGGAIKEHVLDAWSEKRFNEQMTALHTSSVWPLIKAAGLDVLEPSSLLDKRKEEMFQHNFANNIGIGRANLGKFLAIYERAYTSLGNNTRVSLFLKEVADMHNKGMTIENSLEEYKGVASAINNLTGRGSVNAKIAQGVPLATTVLGIWSPKMMASSLNLLGISEIMGKEGGFYQKLPPRARRYAIKQITGGFGIGAGVMLAAAIGGHVVHYDPRDPRFGDVEFGEDGDKSFNVFGRFASVIKVVAQMLPYIGGVKKDGKVTSIYEEGGKTGMQEIGGFFRGKMNPIHGLAYDYILNDKTGYFDKKPITLENSAQNLAIPMSLRSIKDGLERDGTMQVLEDFIPNFVGISMKDQRDYFVNDFGKTPVGLFLEKNKLKVPSNTNSLPKNEKHPEGKMSDEDFQKFTKLKQDKLQEAIDATIKGSRLNGKSAEEKQKEINRLSEKSGDWAKDKLFGKQRKTPQEKNQSRISRLLHKQFDRKIFNENE